ncbi:4Fe-4S dicluster domain-containing protein [Anaerobranca californiensis DSM 14826]|jgi:predicted molibdopterin-dependent oxidoreductase YjgC|uniref:4Fe-4S dicluster domain-containing protein n=1 Tax=Anaerobranca californiensis DSM 14826 TaxID=1120989 RepID=A0A1M6NLL6_9FIRM|nr:4Fe-4S dicluster domain-containing protein [Anaerobranca californiensis DSM 14826]
MKGSDEMEHVSIIIDGKKVSVPKNSTVLEAAKLAGIEIPTLCHHPAISNTGSCRICVVEIEGHKNLPASCVYPVQEGMVINTKSEKVIKSRQHILELLLANHPKDCMTCEAAGNCKLMDYCYDYGVEDSRFEGAVSKRHVDDNNPFIQRDYEKCILCGACVKICDEVQGNNVIDFANRGFDTTISAPFNKDLDAGNCVYCGQCMSVCPTGALTSKISKGKARAWETKKVLTTCSYCGVGCNFYLEVKNDEIVGVSSYFDSPVNGGHLCVKGRFGWDFVNSPDRLKKPLIKKDGKFQEATWEEAIELISTKFKEIKEKYGSDAFAGLASARVTNEDNFAFQKLFRAVLGTNNIDHCARL